jgi:hypothetical protein
MTDGLMVAQNHLYLVRRKKNEYFKAVRTVRTAADYKTTKEK